MQTYVECKSGVNILRGMLHYPDHASKNNKVPMVIILHGFTADRNETAFCHTRLSRELAQEGIASVRFDFAGSGESDGKFSDMSIETETADAIAILKFVQTLEFVDKTNIAFHGMSQGGLVSCMAASRNEAKIKCVSLWAPAFCITHDSMQGSIQDVYVSDIDQKGYVDMRGLPLGAIYYIDAIKSDIYEEMKGFAKPVQIVHGDADDCVPYAFSEKMKKVLGKTCELITVTGANHDFGSIEYNDARIRLAKEFLKRQLL